MAKISHHFRIDETRANELTRLAAFYTGAQKEDSFLPPKKITKTDIVEFLIQKEFASLSEEGFEI
jgi:hypothetical protein